MRIIKFCGLLVGMTFLASCGGGGDTSDPAPNPTPQVPSQPPSQPAPTQPPSQPAPTQNTPPSIVVTVNKASLFEGDLLVFDLTESSDAESYIESYSVNQLSGTIAPKELNINLSTFRFLAPTYGQDIDETLTFEAIVTDDEGATATQVIDVEVKGLAGFGLPVAQYSPALTLEVGNGTSATVGEEAAPYIIASQPVVNSGNDSGATDTVIKIIGAGSSYTNTEYEDDQTVTTKETFSQVSYLDFDSLSFTLQAVFGFEFAVTSIQDNAFYWLTKKDVDDTGTISGEYSIQDQFDIESPCFARGRTNTSENFIWVGQEDIGFSVVDMEPLRDDSEQTIGFSAVVRPQLNNGRSLCFLYPTKLADDLVGNVQNDRLTDLIGIDYNTLEVVLIADTDLDGNYEEASSFPLLADLPVNMTIVDVIPIGLPSVTPRSLYVLLSDGQHDGNHALVLINQDNTSNEISTVEYTWNEGVPISLMYGNFGGSQEANQSYKDIVVFRSTGNTSLLFDNISHTRDIIGDPDIFAAPTEFMTDPGAGSAVKVSGEGNAIEGILASFPDTGLIRLYKVSDSYQRFFIN